MKACSLNEFMAELTPWLDKEHIRSVALEDSGRLEVSFLDGMRHVYVIEDCSLAQIRKVLAGLKDRGVSVES